MLEVSEVGNKLSKEEYKAVEPQLRVGLVNAQYDLRIADFRVWCSSPATTASRPTRWSTGSTSGWTPGSSRPGCSAADPGGVERPTVWRVWRTLPPKGRIAIFAGGLMRLLHETSPVN